MKVCICGIGRAGKAMIEKVLDTDGMELVCVLARDESEYIGKDVGEIMRGKIMGIQILPISIDTISLKKKEIEVIVDFSSNIVTMQLLDICKAIGSKLVICTTNHEEKIIEAIKDFSGKYKLGVVYAPNLTLGINLLLDFVSTMSKILTDFDFEIIERHRKDKPKGTATANIIAAAIDREGVPISSIRLGGYVGIHEVTCANENERLTIVHESFTRQAFANGAMLAVRFVKSKYGFYYMNDVIEELKRKLIN